MALHAMEMGTFLSATVYLSAMHRICIPAGAIASAAHALN